MKKEETAEDVLALARARTAVVFDRFDIPAVSFSGGKDSTVVLNLALEEMRARKADGRLPPDYKLEAIFWDEECIHPPTIEYVSRVAALPDVNLRWFCVPIMHRNACSKKHPYWFCWNPDEREKWARPLPPQAITDLPGVSVQARIMHFECMPFVFPPERGTVGLMMGIRADESLRRYRSVTSRTEDNWLSPVGNARHVQQCKTIYDWTTLDVWTAPFKFGWDWNRAYDQMAKAGLSPSSQRVAHPFGQQPLTTLWMWKVCWPDLWEKVCERVPGASTAGRYANSPLYGSSGGVTKNEGETYQEAVVRELHKWGESVRCQLVERLQREIAKHERVTPGIPIPEEEAYVDLVRGITSGLTWEFLLKIAIKGDFKNRINPIIPAKEQIDEMRVEAWGANWREKYPDIAARTVWSTKHGWMTPQEAASHGIR